MQNQKIYQPKKSLGQNFLKSETALQKIIEAGEIKNNDIILEIGPGKGALTEKLLEKLQQGESLIKGKVIAVEKDWELFEYLKTMRGVSRWLILKENMLFLRIVVVLILR